MLNRPHHELRETERGGQLALKFDEFPNRRLSWLAMVFCVGLTIIGVRLANVQHTLAAREETSLIPASTAIEPIPARNGRILTRDGQILAHDQQRFEVHMHYRWLEEPANEQWLRQSAYRWRREQPNSSKITLEDAKAAVLEQREQLWDHLCEVAEINRATFDESRRELQTRVEKIYEVVLARRESKTVSDEEAEAPANWWQIITQALTTPPHRDRDDPLVILEETQFHPLIPAVPVSAAAEIDAQTEQFPGVKVVAVSRREYPFHNLAAHVIGYRFDTSDDPTKGQVGLEGSYNIHLRGVAGTRKRWFDRDGLPLRDEVRNEPRQGRDLVTSLHVGVQKYLERRLDQAFAAEGKEITGGAAVVMDVRTGEVIALASAPRFDIQLAADRDDDFWNAIREDKSRPLFHRATQAALPPGSVFKPVVGIAAVESGAINADEPFDCAGYLDRPHRFRDAIYQSAGVGHALITLPGALGQSCNVFFFDAGRKTGAEALLEWTRKFGIGSRTGIDLNEEAAGRLPRFDREVDLFAEDRLLEFSVGQSTLTATPLQITRMTAAIANGGRLLLPRLVTGYGVSHVQQSTAVVDDDSFFRIADVSEQTLSIIREGMRQAVIGEGGTAAVLQDVPVPVAAKTGTAQVGGGKSPHAWITGFVPADHPQYAFTVVLEHGGSGGRAAGPIARDMIRAIEHYGLLEK
ncbi:peptidoglycan D,D-transpeptidase FtsI family protein [Calycomorphotria hydatis]|uniref:Stage V sporulation protein D n=1 Tax=Calycomorphotria hydatis TaxID=2528027 RepID=A0A517TAZ9_9PLAN|nr:penicillin-binding transpeptidase domain-containing protein [Calycomorphotria hydatis]QDT65551.1 Stage V sporulation protein D [Calycomorphotria hydatis]